MRHTYAAMRIADGVDIMTLSRDLGHSSPSFTLNRYGHIFDSLREREAPSLNRLLKLNNGTSNGTAPKWEDENENSVQDLPS